MSIRLLYRRLHYLLLCHLLQSVSFEVSVDGETLLSEVLFRERVFCIGLNVEVRDLTRYVRSSHHLYKFVRPEKALLPLIFLGFFVVTSLQSWGFPLGLIL